MYLQYIYVSTSVSNQKWMRAVEYPDSTRLAHKLVEFGTSV